MRQIALLGIFLGAVLLAVGIGLPLWLRGKREGAARMGFVRLRLERGTWKRLRALLRLPPETTALQALQAAGPRLTWSLLALRRELRHAPALPADTAGDPRLLPLALSLSGEKRLDADTMAEALRHFQTEEPLTLVERQALPLLTRWALWEQLNRLLVQLHVGYTDERSAMATFYRLKRSRQPVAVLEKRPLSAGTMAALVRRLRKEEEGTLLALVEERLKQTGTSSDQLLAQQTRRQLRRADELRRLTTALSALETLDWSAACEAVDPLHALLMEDPAGVYPRMTASSRQLYRQRAADWARRFCCTQERLVHAALALSREAQEDALERHVGYFLLESEGLRALRLALAAPQGRMAVWRTAHARTLRRVGQGLLVAAGGLIFLNRYQPLAMLPFFLALMGAIARWLFVPLTRSMAQPQLEITALTEELRTLAVLPVCLKTPQDAVQAARRLAVARATLPKGVDLLLLGDPSPADMPALPTDGEISAAALAAVDALSTAESRVMYMQRARAWDQHRGCFAVRGGRLGAVESVCRLVDQGECEDLLDAANVDPGQLHRRYDFVLALREDVSLAPGAVESMLGTLAHPLCSRIPMPTGDRGYSIALPNIRPDHESVLSGLFATFGRFKGWTGVGLIRPGAFLAATDGRLHVPVMADGWPLAGALAGSVLVEDALALHHTPGDTLAALDDLHFRVRSDMQLLPWCWPWVQTPAGFVASPLQSFQRFLARENLVRHLLPPCQLALLLYSAATGQWLLFLAALVVPEIFRETGEHTTAAQKATQSLPSMALLPVRSWLTLRATALSWAQLVQRRPNADALAPRNLRQEVLWAQGITGGALALLSLLPQPVFLPALLLGAVYACAPVTIELTDAASAPAPLPAPLDAEALRQQATDAFSFFTRLMPSEAPLPPETVQLRPEAGPALLTRPEDAAMLLLSCVCAQELGAADWKALLPRIRRAAQALADCQGQDGLFRRAYDLATLTPQDQRVDAVANGWLCAALMTCAQALRTYLPSLPPEERDLPMVLDNVAEKMDLSRLFDPAAGLFFAYLDGDGQGREHLELRASAGLVLSLVATARREVPPYQLFRLSRARVRVGTGTVPLSAHGTAEEHLLAGLLLPLDPADARRFARLQHRQGQSGLWGQGASLCRTFDPALRYLPGLFGVPVTAAEEPASAQPVYSPAAAALCLPYLPEEAERALAAFAAQGAQGPAGLLDAVDLTPSHLPRGEKAAVVSAYSAFRQGVLVCALAHVLAQAPLRRYFTALPAVAACLPLLSAPLPAPLCLPAPVARPQKETADTSDFTRAVSPLQAPVAAGVLGGARDRWVLNALGSGRMTSSGIPLSRFTAQADMVEGLQCYLRDEDCVFRLTDPMLPGETALNDAEARFVRRCGSISSTLTALVDPAPGRFLCAVELVNLSTVHRVVEFSACVLPDLGVRADALAVRQTQPGTLEARAVGMDRALHLSLRCPEVPLRLISITHAEDFLGRGDLRAPELLLESLQDLPERPNPGSCLAFRAQLRLGGRGRALLLVSLSMRTADCPAADEWAGIRDLAALQARAIRAAVPLTAERAAQLSGLMGPLLWRGQGRKPPLPAPGPQSEWPSALRLTLPLLVVQLESEEGLPLLRAAVELWRWLSLRCERVQLCALCPAAFTEAAQMLAEAASTASKSSIPPLCLTPEAVPDPTAVLFAADVLLREADGPLEAQMAYQAVPLPLPVPPDVAPGDLPPLSEPLLLDNGLGGFDPATLSPVLRLLPRQAPPRPWPVVLQNGLIRATVDESGPHAPWPVRLWLSVDSHAPFEPLDGSLPREITCPPGAWQARAWTDTLEISVEWACVPEQTALAALLRVKNHGEEAVTIHVRVAAILSRAKLSSLAAVEGAVLCNQPQQPLVWLCGAEGSWTALRSTPLAMWGLTGAPAPSAVDDPDGHAALLACDVFLPAGDTAGVSWLLGHAPTADGMEAALRNVISNGASAVLREARALAALALDRFHVDTPEETLDLLLNRVLPAQALSARSAVQALPYLVLVDPVSARDALLSAAREPAEGSSALRLCRLTALYVQEADDAAVLDESVGAQTLRQKCLSMLLSQPVSPEGLLDSPDALTRTLEIAEVLASFEAICSDPALSTLRRRLLTAAEAQGWTGACYGDPAVLNLRTQCFAALCHGLTPRTRAAMDLVWSSLYDPIHGVLSSCLLVNGTALPGTMSNGGQKTADAVLAVAALLRVHQEDRAWELLRALNPLHHTDDPLRTEIYRAAPWYLPGGLLASPASAGAACGTPSAREAAWLWAIAVKELLGVKRRGEQLTLQPRLPSDWAGYDLHLRLGQAAWNLHVDKRGEGSTLDGAPLAERKLRLTDDGKAHYGHLRLHS